METHPANRLPEADSLPDGFVESSAEAPPAANSHESPRDRSGRLGDGSPVFRTAVDDLRSDGAPESVEMISTNAAFNDSVDVDAPDASSSLDYKEVELLQDTGPSYKDEQEHSHSSVLGTEGGLELHACSLKESHTEEHTGSLTCQNKQETIEVKRKAGKHSSKLEKELVELTLKYQKVISERDAAVAVRDRLESLCRELQRQNKILMEECQRVSTEGQNMRLDLSKKFNDAIKDVNSKLEEQKHDCLSQLKENEMLRNKLVLLADQYSLSEQQFAQKLKQKTLELQLVDLKMQQQQERSVQEQSQMQSYVEQVTQLLETEKNLRLQLAADGEKFQQFQDALMKSNEVFETFKQEMEKMAKLIKELKKENEFLKSKCEKSDIALVKLVEEREHMKKKVEKSKNQKEKLESLCRLLHAEIKQNLVGTNNIDSNSMQAKADSTNATI
ncbi:alpha-taxilin [Dendrobium catenatum]|nr:alpha-taxilin [Dendrobium catenatum]XP_020687880.1 alpha-taxilin [Dendrobium catenatum]XP_028556207.1 alpha-taxilin [Dendrobium catenatum]